MELLVYGIENDMGIGVLGYALNTHGVYGATSYTGGEEFLVGELEIIMQLA